MHVASSSAWSNPRWRFRRAVVGAQVTTSIAAASGPRARVISCASHPKAAWRFRYFARATSSLTTPSYANGTESASNPAGTASAGAGRVVAVHAGHIGSAVTPQPGHRAGNTSPSTVVITVAPYDKPVTTHPSDRRYLDARRGRRRAPVGFGTTPASVTSADTRRAGVTSNAGFHTSARRGAVRTP